MTSFTPEIIEKAREAKSAEELLTMAKDGGVELTEEEAATYFDQLNPKSGELSDDELENVAGGGRCNDPVKKFPEGCVAWWNRGYCGTGNCMSQRFRIHWTDPGKKFYAECEYNGWYGMEHPRKYFTGSPGDNQFERQD